MPSKKPILQALILADQVYMDAMTGKKIIAGTFNRLLSATFPSMFGTMTWAYVCVTEVHSEASIVLQYVDLSMNKVLMKTKEFRFSAPDPLLSTEMVLQVPPFPMPHPGTYALEVHSGGEMLGSLRISVEQIQELQK